MLTEMDGNRVASHAWEFLWLFFPFLNVLPLAAASSWISYMADATQTKDNVVNTSPEQSHAHCHKAVDQHLR